MRSLLSRIYREWFVSWPINKQFDANSVQYVRINSWVGIVDDSGDEITCVLIVAEVHMNLRCVIDLKVGFYLVVELEDIDESNLLTYIESATISNFLQLIAN